MSGLAIKLWGLVAAIGVVLAACQPAAAPPPQPSSASPTQAASQPTAAAPVALKVSYSNVIADNLPEWMAYESGIFKQHGLDVELTNIASSNGIAALLAGQVQVAQLGGSEVLSAAANGGDLMIIGNVGAVYPFVFMVPADITSMDQLRGKAIGVSNVGSSSDIATRVMLRKVGLDPNHDVTIVAVGSLEQRMAALTNGAIQGGLAQPPDQLALQDKGFHVLYDLAAEKLPSANTAITVQRSWLNANRDVAQRYIDSIVEAIARSRSDKDLALKVLAKYLKNDDQRALQTTYDFFVGQVTPTYPTTSTDQFADVIAQLSPQNDKIASFDLNKLLDPSFVQSAIDRHLGGS